MRPALSLLAALGLTVTTVGAPATLAQSVAADAPAAIEAQGGGPAGGGDRDMGSQMAARPMVGRARLMSTEHPFIRGTVLLRQSGANQTAVIVTVYGLEPGSEHVNHIHGGSCTGGILFPLQNLVADKSGVARAVSSVPAAINPETWWVNVHAGYALPSPGITCGEVQSPPARVTSPGDLPVPRPGSSDRPGGAPAAPPAGSDRR
jgi:hypothetical protein